VWALVAMLTGCDSAEEQKRRDDAAFFPLQKGVYQLYDVEEIIYELSEPETLRYELKTVLIDSFRNAQSGYTYIMQRSKRPVGETSWVSLEPWSVRKETNEIVVHEGNIPFVVLTFPISEDLTWNGNKYNTVINPTTKTNEDEYRVLENNVERTINSVEFSDCLVVEQEDNQEFIVFYDKRTEIYARNIGLIYKERIELQYCNDQDRNCVGQQIVDQGVIYRQSIKAYGKE